MTGPQKSCGPSLFIYAELWPRFKKSLRLELKYCMKGVRFGRQLLKHMMPTILRNLSLLLLASALAAFAPASRAACMNKFLVRSDGPRQVVTLLTGKLTYQEAQVLAASIQKEHAPPLEWVDDSGRTLAKQFGALQVVRPMPVGCDARSSGVVMITRFGSFRRPSRRINVKFPTITVAFEEQTQ